jgi:hypothetical protein
MAEGSSAQPDAEAATVEWSYLSGNQWQPLAEGNLLEDGTRGLINSGIITFSLPAAEPNTLLPSDLYWLRAAVAERAHSVLETVAIHTQAISATLVNAEVGSPQSTGGLPLAPESISDFLPRIRGVAGVRQPYTSFGGKRAEEESHFATRVSERLRHKERSLTLWDYEHLILEAFPEIYKVKCLPAPASAPGEVEVILIPDVKNKVPFIPFEPKAPANLIADIRAYLAEITPPFATIKVRNATFAAVKVRVAVRFMPGYEEGFHKQRLNEELNRFLSPWAYEEGAEIVIGGRIYANVIIAFIEERPYVDYVTHIRLFVDNVPQEKVGDEYFVEASGPDVVLASAREHVIDMIPESGYDPQLFSGINYMRVELDFKIAPDPGG